MTSALSDQSLDQIFRSARTPNDDLPGEILRQGSVAVSMLLHQRRSHPPCWHSCEMRTHLLLDWAARRRHFGWRMARPAVHQAHVAAGSRTRSRVREIPAYGFPRHKRHDSDHGIECLVPLVAGPAGGNKDHPCPSLFRRLRLPIAPEVASSLGPRHRARPKSQKRFVRLGVRQD